MSKFFIDRPIFAWVIAIIIMLAGALSITTLPISQYPQIAPPAVTISATYPGASAKTLEDSVTQVIEQKMKGLDGLRYMSSSSSSDGSASITLTFDAGTNPDIAQVQVQNKVQLATPSLPQSVQAQGLTVTKSTMNFLMIVGFYSEDGSMSDVDIADYVVSNLQDPLSRVPGVGDVQAFGSQYAMRIWLNPSKLNEYKLTPADVQAAIQAQNTQVSAGQLGGAPGVKGQQLNATITAQSRLKSADEFRNILLVSKSDGSTVKLGEVARVELGSESYEVISRYNGKSASGIGIKLATGANAMKTAAGVQAKLDQLAQFYPKGLKHASAYDTTPFVKISIEEVVKTLLEAIVLVFLVMYLFLQNIRATLIPTIAVPVVLLGTFGVLAAFGFSINTLTMFGMVLAIGLLVDDAIVVVENVERVMSEEGLSPYEATKKSMSQITGALVGIALVLSAVLVPMAFFGGSTGIIYRQFSITIVSAMVLSVIVALILTPALCATLLKPMEKGHAYTNKGFFGWFNRKFDHYSTRYQGAVGRILHKATRWCLVYLGIVGGMLILFWHIPGAFLPDEDQGMLFTQIQLPSGATQERTLNVVKQVENHFLSEEKATVDSVFSVVGFSFAGNGQNSAMAFVNLKDWSERPGSANTVKAITGRAMGTFSQIRDAMVFAFAPPAVVELGNASGFDLELVDRGGLGHEKLMEARNMFLGMAMKDPRLTSVRPNGQDDTPQFQLDIDLPRAEAMGLTSSDINNTLSIAWGGAYVNDFVDKNRVKKVYLQADAPYRMLPTDIDRLYVRNSSGSMVPFSAFSKSSWKFGPSKLERYNGVSAVEIVGEPAHGLSSGQAMKAVEEIAAKLPNGIGIEWTGLSYEERMAGSQTLALYTISMLVVFLCLAALYESWSVPFSVLLGVPLGIFGALLAATARGLSDDVYFQVGLLTTIGLAAKNAILIVEFAMAAQAQGRSLIDSALEAVRMRLRPILMTSLAFGLGVLPLAISRGAGSGSQNAIGTGVLGGVISATALGIFFVPLFYVVVRGFFVEIDWAGLFARLRPKKKLVTTKKTSNDEQEHD